MKRLFFTLLICFTSIFSFSHDIFKDVTAYEAAELTQKTTSYNDYLNKTYVASEGKKFIVIQANINKEAVKDAKAAEEELFFESNGKKYLPVGTIERGEMEFKSARDLNLEYAYTIGYVYSVEKSVKNGSLKLGQIAPLEITEFSKEGPVVPEPKLVKVTSSTILDKFEAVDKIARSRDHEEKVKVVYTPFSGKFLKVKVNVLPPAKKEIESMTNYNFHPDHFYITAADGTLYKCAAFIREGNYDNPFSESMNNNVMYKETDPKELVLVFFFGETKGEYNLFHKGKKTLSFTVK